MLQNPQLHYLDNAATTIVAPEVADVINKAMREHWANPSSLYGPGARSEEALNAARAAVARTLGCKSRELYFTSCGSESNNLALLGAVQTRTFGKGIVVSGFEHPSVQRPLDELAKQGYNVTVVKPRPDGTLDINEMLEHVDKNTILVACMMVNNEVGTRNDVEHLAAEVKRRNSRTIVHVDAVQAWMRVPIKLDNIDTLSVSGHKIKVMPEGLTKELTQALERVKAQIRARVEHPFHIVKNLFGHKKLRYRGLVKNGAQLTVMFALANLVLLKRPLLTLQGIGAP